MPIISFVPSQSRTKDLEALERASSFPTPDQTLYVWQEAGLAPRHDPRALAFPARSLSADAGAGKRTPQTLGAQNGAVRGKTSACGIHVSSDGT